MKSQRLVFFGLLLCGACGSDPATPADSGSAGRGGSGGSASTGGSSGSGGSAGTGGASGSGGSAGNRDAATARDTAAPGRDGGAARDGGSGDRSAGEGGTLGPAPGSPGAALHDFVFQLPCPMPTTGNSCTIPDAQRNKMSAPIQFGGDPAVTYHVRLHICGALEGREYNNCQGPMMGGGLFCPGGMIVNTDQFSASYPTYQMAVTAPMQTYFLNNRRARDVGLKIDYSAELDIRGGATITFGTVSEGTNVFTSRNGGPHVCPNVPGIMQPFPGQFIHFQVESVTPNP